MQIDNGGKPQAVSANTFVFFSRRTLNSFMSRRQEPAASCFLCKHAHTTRYSANYVTNGNSCQTTSAVNDKAQRIT